LPLADDPPLPCETERYGHYSVAGEAVYDRPFQFGSKRTGPDLARVAGATVTNGSAHIWKTLDLVPESNMPAYPWLSRTMLNPKDIEPKMRVLRTLGAPYSDEELAGAQNEVTDKTEQDAIVAYLQVLGTAIKSKN